MSEARTEDRLGRLEDDVREIKATLARLEPMIIRIDATLPHLATKAELADKPSRAYLWGVMGAMVGAQAVALGAAALIFMMIQPAHSEPFDWDRYHARQDACLEKDLIAADCVRGSTTATSWHCDRRRARARHSPDRGSAPDERGGCWEAERQMEQLRHGTTRRRQPIDKTRAR